jgi:hypothetical protein
MQAFYWSLLFPTFLIRVLLCPTFFPKQPYYPYFFISK